MEAKLRAWLESKGKTNSSQQRLGPFNSPLVKKTPGSIISSAKRSVNFNTSVKEARTSTKKDAKQTTERNFSVSFRNLLDGEVAFDSCKEDNDKREIEHEANNVACESYNNLTVEISY
ncbi:kinesin-like protein KIF22-like [Trifolium medium]|uniref:Kinesin-like protein KIF22-like n=1 Tax=Trifolium medium TaxID=97028 RepID=A0A392P4T8_9FABA|nr:kinesin-like protein KIF22-like [Trifolium medium]